jgi:hypothetical protein
MTNRDQYSSRFNKHCTLQGMYLRAPTDCMYVRVISALAAWAGSLPKICCVAASSSWSFR